MSSAPENISEDIMASAALDLTVSLVGGGGGADVGNSAERPGPASASARAAPPARTKIVFYYSDEDEGEEEAKKGESGPRGANASGATASTAEPTGDASASGLRTRVVAATAAIPLSDSQMKEMRRDADSLARAAHQGPSPAPPLPPSLLFPPGLTDTGAPPASAFASSAAASGALAVCEDLAASAAEDKRSEDTTARGTRTAVVAAPGLWEGTDARGWRRGIPVSALRARRLRRFREEEEEEEEGEGETRPSTRARAEATDTAEGEEEEVEGEGEVVTALRSGPYRLTLDEADLMSSAGDTDGEAEGEEEGSGGGRGGPATPAVDPEYAASVLRALPPPADLAALLPDGAAAAAEPQSTNASGAEEACEGVEEADDWDDLGDFDGSDEEEDEEDAAAEAALDEAVQMACIARLVECCESPELDPAIQRAADHFLARARPLLGAEPPLPPADIITALRGDMLRFHKIFRAVYRPRDSPIVIDGVVMDM